MGSKLWMVGVLWAVACTEPLVGDETSDGSSTGATSTGSGETTSAGSDTSAGGTASSGGSSDSTGAPPLDCSPYLDDQAFAPRDVVVTNESTEPVLVAAIEPCREEYLAVEPEAAGTAGALPSSNSCNLTCQTWFEGVCGCPTDCVTAPTVLLEPGAVLVLPWSGAVYVDEPAPEGCYESEGFIDCAQPTCPALRAASGEYRLTVRWAPTSALDEACLCVPDATGLCTIEKDPLCPLFDPPNAAQAVFEHPSREVIALVL